MELPRKFPPTGGIRIGRRGQAFRMRMPLSEVAVGTLALLPDVPGKTTMRGSSSYKRVQASPVGLLWFGHGDDFEVRAASRTEDHPTGLGCVDGALPVALERPPRAIAHLNQPKWSLHFEDHDRRHAGHVVRGLGEASSRPTVRWMSRRLARSRGCGSPPTQSRTVSAAKAAAVADAETANGM